MSRPSSHSFPSANGADVVTKSRPLHRHRVVITAGPTQEPLDPVRYLTNASSGEMGIVLSDVLSRWGADVTLVLGPTSLPVPHRIRVIRVKTALEMNRAVAGRLRKMDTFIGTAAVSDFRFDKIHRQKIKKSGRQTLVLRLKRNPDILASVGAYKRRTGQPRILVGFALETQNLAQAAAQKLRDKNLDLIIGNDPSSLSNARIRPFWLERDEKGRPLSPMTKKTLARHLARWIVKRISHG